MEVLLRDETGIDKFLKIHRSAVRGWLIFYEKEDKKCFLMCLRMLNKLHVFLLIGNNK